MDHEFQQVFEQFMDAIKHADYSTREAVLGLLRIRLTTLLAAVTTQAGAQVQAQPPPSAESAQGPVSPVAPEGKQSAWHGSLSDVRCLPCPGCHAVADARKPSP